MEKLSTSTKISTNTETPKRTRWDTTPIANRDLNVDIKKNSQPVQSDKTPLRMGQTPSRFSETPYRPGETPKNSRWDDKTPMAGTPAGYIGMTPTPGGMKTPDILNITPSKLNQLRW
jgi:hypothetical protein